MRIVFEINETLLEIINDILTSRKWKAELIEEIEGRKTYLIKDLTYDSPNATVEVYEKEIIIQTAWSKYIYRLYRTGNKIFCEYSGAYRGLLEQNLLPTITPKELLDSTVLDSSLFGDLKKTLREYAEENVKLKNFRREHFREEKNGTAPFDHPKKVYDEFIKEDFIP